MSKISNFLVGTVGVTGIEAVNQIDFPSLTQTKEATSLILQIVIAIATLFKMFKKQKAS